MHWPPVHHVLYNKALLREFLGVQISTLVLSPQAFNNHIVGTIFIFSWLFEISQFQQVKLLNSILKLSIIFFFIMGITVFIQLIYFYPSLSIPIRQVHASLETSPTITLMTVFHPHAAKCCAPTHKLHSHHHFSGYTERWRRFKGFLVKKLYKK